MFVPVCEIRVTKTCVPWRNKSQRRWQLPSIYDVVLLHSEGVAGTCTNDSACRHFPSSRNKHVSGTRKTPIALWYAANRNRLQTLYSSKSRTVSGRFGTRILLRHGGFSLSDIVTTNWPPGRLCTSKNRTLSLWFYVLLPQKIAISSLHWPDCSQVVSPCENPQLSLATRCQKSLVTMKGIKYGNSLKTPHIPRTLVTVHVTDGNALGLPEPDPVLTLLFSSSVTEQAEIIVARFHCRQGSS